LSESRSRSARPSGASSRSDAPLNPFLRWWLRDPIERNVFRLAAVYMRRDRELKLRLYPSLSMCIIFPLMGLFDPGRGGVLGVVPITTWMLGIMPLTALEALRMSSHYAAADLFLVAPLASAAPLYHGVRKAVLYYLLIPAVVVTGALSAALAAGGRDALVLAIPGLIAIPTLSLIPGVMQPYLPLSRPAARGDQTSRNVGVLFIAMLTMAAVIGLSWLADSIGWLWEMVALEIVGAALLHRAFSRIVQQPGLRQADARGHGAVTT
jgi:ABC-2 type transport system permease protein